MEMAYNCQYDYLSINGRKFCGDKDWSLYQNSGSVSVNITVYTDEYIESEYVAVYLACTSSLDANQIGSNTIPTVWPNWQESTDGYSNELDSQCYYGIIG